MKCNELIVSFSHSNYAVKVGGTEKFVSELSEVLQARGFDHLCFYPFAKRNMVAGKAIVGVNYNDQFIGVIWAKDIPDTIRYFLRKYELRLNCFHIQHLRQHDIDNVLASIQAFNVKVNIFVHDFYFVCHSLHFINSSGEFCGDNVPSRSKCEKCKYYEEEISHQKKMYSFLNGLEERVGVIVCHSEYVKSVFDAIFPNFAKKSLVRPHLAFSGNKRMESISGEIRIAFPGRKQEQKGYDKWEKIVTKIKTIPQYKLFYLGKEVEEDDEVKSIFVSVTEQGKDAMKNAVADNGINCAFLWPQCPETYSYVYYELIMSGVYIITNKNSGNIYDEVQRRKNGVAFDSLEECIAWLEDPGNVEKEINQYRRGSCIPESYSTNADISMLISDKAEKTSSQIKTLKVLPISTLLYRMKYRKYRL